MSVSLKSIIDHLTAKQTEIADGASSLNLSDIGFTGINTKLGRLTTIKGEIQARLSAINTKITDLKLSPTDTGALKAEVTKISASLDTLITAYNSLLGTGPIPPPRSSGAAFDGPPPGTASRAAASRTATAAARTATAAARDVDPFSGVRVEGSTIGGYRYGKKSKRRSKTRKNKRNKKRRGKGKSRRR